MTQRAPRFWILCGLVMVCCAGWIRFTHEPLTRSVFDGEVPPSDPQVISFTWVKNQLPNQEWVGLILTSETSILSPDTVALVRTMTERFARTPSIVPESIRSLTNVRVIVPGDELATEPLVVDSWLKTASIERLRHRLEQNPLLKRELVGKSELATVIGGYVAPGFHQGRVAHDLQLQVQAVHQAGVEVLPVGNIIANQAMDEGIDAQSTIFALIALGIVLGLFVWLKMTAAGCLMVFLLLASLVELKAIQILLAIPDSVVLSATPLLLIALGVSYFYYFAREAAQHGVAEAVNRLTKPTWFSVIATAYGFGTLYTFKILSIREFGLVTAIGIFVVFVNVWKVYPALFTIWPRLLPAKSYGLEPILVGATNRLMAWSSHWLCLVLMLAAVYLGQLGQERLHTNTDPFRFFPPNHPVVTGLHALEQFGGNSELIIAITPKSALGQLPWTSELMQELLALEQRLRAIPKVGDVTGYASLADSVADKYYPPEFRGRQPFPKQISGLLEQLVPSAELERVISLDRQTIFIRVWATAWTTDEVKVILEQIRLELKSFMARGYRDVALDGPGSPPFFALGGFDTLWIAIGKYIVAGKLANFWWAILLMPLVAWPFVGDGGQGWRGRILRSIIVTVPLAAALHETLGVMGWAGIQLDLATCVITSIGIGVGEDFAIHLLHYSDRSGSCEGAASENAELLTYALLTAAGFASFALSGFLPLRQFAGLVMLILALSYVNAMLLVPIGVRLAKILLRKVKKRA